MHRVRVVGNRPDFRVFIGLLYSDLHNVNTDGDSFSVESRDWTNLYVKDRESDDPSVEIIEELTGPYFEVSSDSERLETIVALYLMEYCGDSIERNSLELPESAIGELRTKYEKELERGRTSVWHQSSPDVPYPNK